MKKMMKYSLLLAMGLSLVSCFDQPETSTTSGGGSTTSYGGTTNNGGSTNDNGGTTNNGGTTGTTGTGGYPPITWNVSYVFGVDWHPRNTAEWDARFCNHPDYNTYSENECLAANNSIRSMTTPTLNDAYVEGMTDSRYKIRITVKPMPTLQGVSNNPKLKDKLHCFRRLYPGMPVAAYSSLKFKTYLQEVNCSGSNCSLGNIRAQSIKEHEVSVGSSTIIDYSSDFYRPSSDSSYTLRIEQVKKQDDSVRDYDCWEMKVELATDSTQDF